MNPNLGFSLFVYLALQLTNANAKRPVGSIAAAKCDEYAEQVNTCPFEVSPLIAYGLSTKPKEFPHMVAIRCSIKYFCGGSLISENFVLTAAHCVHEKPAERITEVYMGGMNPHKQGGPQETGFVIPVAEAIPHPDFEHTKVADIALLRLARPVKFSEYVRPLCLHTGFQNLPKKAIIAGWGQRERKKKVTALLKLEINRLPDEKCEEEFFSFIPGNQYCYGDEKEQYRDACPGDSGGPLVIYHPEKDCMYTQIGIVSFGPDEDCGETNLGVYSSVWQHLDWIEKIVWPNYHHRDDISKN